MLGGNGIGKSTLVVNCLLDLLLPYYGEHLNPWFYRYKFFNNRERWANYYGPNGNLHLVYIIRRDLVDMVLMKELQKWAPKGSFTSKRGEKKYDYLVEFRGGGVLTIFTPDQDVRQLEGWNVDGFFSDEQFPMALYREGMQRTRGRGFWWSVMTPLFDEQAQLYIDEMEAQKPHQHVLMSFHKESACMEHSIRGFRTHAAIAEDIRKCDPDEFAARVEGKPMHRSGKLFKQFRYTVNVLPDSEVIELVRKWGATFYAGCDPHEARPDMIAWCAVLGDPQQRIIWVDEWPEWDPGLEAEPVLVENRYLEFYLKPRMIAFHKISGIAIDPYQFCEVVKAKETEIIRRFAGEVKDGVAQFKSVGTKIHRRFIDPRAGSRKPKGSRDTVKDMFARAGIYFEKGKAEVDLKEAHDEMRLMLAGKMDEEGTYLEVPRMYYSTRCVNLIHHTANLSFKVDVKKGAWTGQAGDKLSETYKDGVDLQRYVIRRKPNYQPTKEVREEREQIKQARQRGPKKRDGILSGL
jgi:hypothetical protein